jgi:hypothetical protein
MAYDMHDMAVMNRINRYIDQANATMPKATVAEKLTWCWSANIAERETDSTDTVGRDADYYFAARHMIAADSSRFAKLGTYAIGTVATGVYIGLKTATMLLGIDRVMRTDPDKPNADPGGFVWEQIGSSDGFRDSGAMVAPVIRHLPAPALTADDIAQTATTVGP